MSLSPRDQFALLDPEERDSAIRLFAQRGGDIQLLEQAWRGWKARPEQLINPRWTAFIILFLTGRGFGKTEAGSQWIHEEAMQRPKGRGALLARTSSDVRDTMVEGESGIMATAPKGLNLKYEPSKRRITWPNGFKVITFSAEEPDGPRGTNVEIAWADEAASFKSLTGTDGLTALDNLRFATRIKRSKRQPRIVITTTPKRTKLIKDLQKDPKVRVVRGSMMDNAHNLSQEFIDQILIKYAGTSLGSQEIEGLLASDVEGSLFKSPIFEATRILNLDDLPTLSKPVVAVDPSAGDGSRDECGITVGALSASPLPTTLTSPGGLSIVRSLRHAYVLEDGSLSAPPDKWAQRVSELAEKHETTTVVAEQNQGFEMVRSVLRNTNPSLRVKLVNATRGKKVRAQPVAAIFAQGRGHLVGEFGELEDQCTTWVPDQDDSPDRMDSMVWLITHLLPEIARDSTIRKVPDMSQNITGAA